MSMLRQRWMERVRMTRDPRLTEITIPGTHDTGTWPKPAARASWCQSMTLKDQLESGIRFIDIRLVPTFNPSTQRPDLEVWHGDATFGTNEGLWFSTDIVGACQTFLANNPSEVIIMSVKNEHAVPDANFNAALDPFVRNSSGAAGPLFYDKTIVPRLSEAAGQIVLFRRYGGSPLGIDATIGWPNDNETTTPTSGPVPMMIQDIYKMRYAWEGPQKASKVLAFLQAALNDAGTSRWWLNFSSTSGGAVPKDFANAVNLILQRWLESTLQSLGGKKTARLGTIIMDFPTARMIDALIITNFLQVPKAVHAQVPYQLNMAHLHSADTQGYVGPAHFASNRWNYGQAYVSPASSPMPHTLVKVAGSDDPFEIHAGDTVMLMSTEFTNDEYVNLSGNGDGINCVYDKSSAADVRWVIERSPLDPTHHSTTAIALGDPVRFRNLHVQRGGKPGYLVAGNDSYLDAIPPEEVDRNKMYPGSYDWKLSL